MLEARFRPLPKWTESRKLTYARSPFKSPYVKTLDKLESELRILKARDVVIEAGFQAAQIRNDGWPRGKERPSHPGVILYFTGKDGPLRFPCGTYGRYEDNLRAIALTLENLRAIDRYGVTLGHEQYQGFKALPAPKNEIGTVEDAAAFLATQAGLDDDIATHLIEDPQAVREAYRMAAARLHPDKSAGNVHLWHLLQTAVKLLDGARK